jgi:hypothetical protein
MNVRVSLQAVWDLGDASVLPATAALESIGFTQNVEEPEKVRLIKSLMLLLRARIGYRLFVITYVFR